VKRVGVVVGVFQGGVENSDRVGSGCGEAYFGRCGGGSSFLIFCISMLRLSTKSRFASRGLEKEIRLAQVAV